MDPDTVATRQPGSGLVRRPAIAEQDDIRDISPQKLFVQEFGPLLHGPAKIEGAGQIPENAISTVEIDAMDAMSLAPQPAGKPAEERTYRSLQEEIVASRRSGNGFRHPVRFVKRTHRTIKIIGYIQIFRL